jgi:Concanavalin A-like lectin/glucanases superfamily
MKPFSLRNRYSTRTLMLVAAIAPIVLLLIGGGVYAALGGVVRPQASTDIELQRGLVGHWRLDGNLKDSTPFSNNGIAHAVSPTIDRKGKTSGAYAVPGGSSTVEVPDAPTLNLASDITVSAWIKPSVALQTNFARVVTKYDGITINYLLAYDSTGKMRFIVDGNSRVTATGTTTLNDTNHWYHIVGVRSGNTLYIYVDGVQESSAAITGASKTVSSSLFLGGGQGASFQGSVDDTRVYNRAFSSAEVSALLSEYDTSLKVGAGSSGLVGHWRFDGSPKDSTPNANNGTATNVTLTSDRKGALNSAYNFAGTSTSCVVLPVSSQLNSSVFTFAAWIKPSASGTQTIIGSSSSGNPQFRVEAGNKITLLKQNVSQLPSSTGSITTGEWNHVVVSYSSSGEYVYYINGLPSGSGIDLQTFSFPGYRIGCKTIAEHFAGDIDDVRMYNRVLSPAEVGRIANTYNSQVNLRTNNGTSGSVNLSSGLAGHWAMNGNVLDSTPNGNNGSIIGGAVLTTDRMNQAGKAYSFNGAPQLIQVGTSSVLGFTDNFTLSAWIHPTGYNTTDFFGLKNGVLARGPASTYNYGIQISNATTIAFVKRTSPETLQYRNFTVPSLTNKWSLVTMTISGGTVKLYLNGQYYASLSTGTIASGPSDNLYIGSMTNNRPETSFIGKLDDVRIYGRVLNTAEIAALYYTYF